jgi:transcriptional regulator with PAS, ATPase and Fis domain
MDRFVTGISEDAMKLLTTYDWPGNIRELENAIERAINLVNKEAIINVNHLPYYIREQNASLAGSAVGEGLRDLVAQLEIKEIKNALEICDQNKQQAAKYLGISRTNLYEKMAKYSL